MARITFIWFPRLAALLAATVLGLALATGASADAPPGRGPNGGPAPSPSPTPPAGDCAVLRVQLNGDQPATETCLATTQAMQGTNPSTQISITFCGSHDLKLYEHPNFGGKQLCFTGSGTVNLRDYHLRYTWCSPWCGGINWNDQVSSYRTGSSLAVLYEHPDASGSRLRDTTYQSRASMPYGWNDRISSICLTLYWAGCP